MKLLRAFFALCSLLLVSMTVQSQRLPTNARPEHYRLSLTPDLKAATFRGTETIDLRLAAPASTITLNAIELKIDHVTASNQPGTIAYDEAKEQVTFSFPNPLPAGPVALELAYSGILNDKLRGFYLSKTKARSYAVTQFESTDARRAFPNFDEPALKATYDVSLTIDQADTAISNTNIVSDTSQQPGKHTLVFATTPKISSYLVAFLIGDFACSKGSADGIPIRVCSTPDKVKLTKFAVKAAEHFLTYYDRYFGIKYPMPKLDLIGIPDFEAGAMENFGAITYRETALLVDAHDGSISAKKRVASVIAHEMAHQWFGDLVTMQWWDNLWLNEGFATWMQDKAASDWHPEWGYKEDAADELNATLNYDSARTTRTIRTKAETPAQISELFDGIAYGKAGAVIGMVEQYVGEDRFRRGVHDYLQAHLYANANAEDFWNAQKVVSELPVDDVMASFVDLPGVPLLTVQPATGDTLTLGQSRFFLSPQELVEEKDSAPASTKWVVPVCYKTTGRPDCQLLGATAPPNRAKENESKPTASSPLFYANANEKGYYRVAYTPAQVAAITAAAETTLTVPERIGFLGDRWAFIRSGQGSVGEYLDLALALKSDPSSQVVDSLLRTIGQIRSRIATPEDRVQLNAMVRARFGPVYAALPAQNKHGSIDLEERRTELFQALGAAGDPAVLARARQIAEELFAGHKSTAPALVDDAVGLAAINGDEPFYERVQVVSQKAIDPGLQSEALQMLTRFRAPILSIRTLEYAVSGQVRNQDSWILIAIELSQPETRDVAWSWVQLHWDRVQAQLTTASGANVVAATGSFCTVAQRTQVASFFAEHPVPAAERSLAKALDSIDECVKLRAAQEPRLHEWLQSHPN